MTTLRSIFTLISLQITIFCCPARAENPYANLSGDVFAKNRIQATASVLYQYLLDLQNMRDLWPETCIKGWEFGEVTRGPGASARVTYVPSVMHRTLVATISRVDENRRIDIDHVGKRGFITTWRLTEADGATEVEVHTWINPPPAPFKAYYFKKVHPAWTACHEAALDNLRRKARELR